RRGKSREISKHASGPTVALRGAMKTLLIAVAAAASLLHCSADSSSSAEELDVGATFDRIAQARLYISSAKGPTVYRTLPYEEGLQTGYAATVAGHLHSLSPTYVSGLIRYNGPLPATGHALQKEEIDGYNAV